LEALWQKKEIIMFYLCKDKCGILVLIIILEGMKVFKQYMWKMYCRIH